MSTSLKWQSEINPWLSLAVGVKPYYEEPGIVIFCSDCREILPHLPPVDLVLTDPPYGVGFRYESYKDTKDAWSVLVPPVIKIVRDMAPLVIVTCGTKQLWDYERPNGILCWAHPGSTRMNTLGGFSEWEPILVYGKRRIYNDFKYLPDCSNHSPEAEPHPCPKPLRLFSWLVKIGSDGEAKVLDPFMGSGTTLRAAKDLGRKAIGIEIEEKYCEIAVRRLRQEVLPFGKTQGVW